MMTTKRLLFQSVSQCEIIFLSLESAVTLLLYLFKFTVITMYVTWYCISRCWYVYRRNERENTVGRSLRKISESVTEFETWIKCAREPGAFCAWHGHTESKVTRAYIQNNAIIFRQPLYILRYATSYVSLDVTMAIWTCVCSSLLLSISLYVYMLYGSRIPSSISFWRFITHSISSSSFSLFWSLERSLLFAYIYTYIYSFCKAQRWIGNSLLLLPLISTALQSSPTVFKVVVVVVAFIGTDNRRRRFAIWSWFQFTLCMDVDCGSFGLFSVCFEPKNTLVSRRVIRVHKWHKMRRMCDFLSFSIRVRILWRTAKRTACAISLCNIADIPVAPQYPMFDSLTSDDTINLDVRVIVSCIFVFLPRFISLSRSCFWTLTFRWH